MTDNAALKALADNGVSVWLDDLSRERIETGNLQELIDTKGVVGVTTNPSIFQAALAKGDRYDADLRRSPPTARPSTRPSSGSRPRTSATPATSSGRVYDSTNGVDGRVSIEVDPRLAHDTGKTVDAGQGARRRPSTAPTSSSRSRRPSRACRPSPQTLAEGISVNVTLIFSLDRYRGVMNAFLTGLEQAREAGKDLSQIHSVASFFVSRVDTEVDKRLDAIGTDEAKALKGKAAVANARLAYQAYEEVFATPRWKNLADDGANAQRPLWASTGVKDPAYSDTLYVTELVAPHTVNTMPEKTLDAVVDHGEVTGDTVTGTYEDAGGVLDALEGLGISYADVTAQLEPEGVDKFEASWGELLDEAQSDLDLARAERRRAGDK